LGFFWIIIHCDIAVEILTY